MLMALSQQEILAGLAEIVNEVAGIPAADVQLDKSFTDDLDVDSLSMVEVVVAAEEKFGVRIPDDDVKNLKTVGDAVTYIDKAGAILRPRIDQLPGACVDFYALQNAVVFNSAAPIVLACTDAPLVTMGPLEAGPVRLMGEGAPNVDEVYSWVMNNFWETNFKASLGGFHQFHYELAVLEGSTIETAFEVAETMNEGVLQFCVFDGEPLAEPR